jgi:transposase-like protein
VDKQRKITDEREARRCLAAARAAGGTVGRWARANGIDGRSLNAWRMNLARRGKGGTPPPMKEATALHPRAALVELVPTPRPTSARRYAVQLGDALVEFGDDFDPHTLRRVLEVLRAC